MYMLSSTDGHIIRSSTARSGVLALDMVKLVQRPSVH